MVGATCFKMDHRSVFDGKRKSVNQVGDVAIRIDLRSIETSRS